MTTDTPSAVRCFGLNYLQALGRDSTVYARLGPGDVHSVDAPVSLSTGDLHTCMVSQSIGVMCWGSNALRQQGTASDGTEVPHATGVPGLRRSDGVVAAAAGGFSTCAVLASGQVRCVGASDMFDGGPDVPATSTPTAITGLTDATQVAVGSGFGCATRKAGGSGGRPSVACWGVNKKGQLGNDSLTAASSAVQVLLP